MRKFYSFAFDVNTLSKFGSGDLFESDIVLTMDQMDTIEREYDRTGGRFKRKVISGQFYRWKSTTISYTIASSSCKTGFDCIITVVTEPFFSIASILQPDFV